MTTPELPPLSSDLALFHALLPTDERDTYWRVINSIEARERILLARIAELEADAERYRWLRDESGNSYDTPYARCESGKWKDDWLTGEHLDAAIDAARGKA